MPRSKVLLGSGELMALATSIALSLAQRREIQYCMCNGIQDSVFRYRITEQEETSKFWSGPLIPSRACKPAWFLRMQTWGWGRGHVFPSWSVLATHTPQSRDIHPLSWEAVDASSGSAFGVFHREGLWREKVPFAWPQYLSDLLCPNVLGHTQYSVGNPHWFSPGITGVMSLTLWKAPDKHAGVCSHTEWLWLLAGAALRQTNRCCRWARWGTFNIGSAAVCRGLLPFHQAWKQPSVQPLERPDCGLERGWPGSPPLANRDSDSLCNNQTECFSWKRKAVYPSNIQLGKPPKF